MAQDSSKVAKHVENRRRRREQTKPRTSYVEDPGGHTLTVRSRDLARAGVAAAATVLVALLYVPYLSFVGVQASLLVLGVGGAAMLGILYATRDTDGFTRTLQVTRDGRYVVLPRFGKTPLRQGAAKDLRMEILHKPEWALPRVQLREKKIPFEMFSNFGQQDLDRVRAFCRAAGFEYGTEGRVEDVDARSYSYRRPVTNAVLVGLVVVGVALPVLAPWGQHAQDNRQKRENLQDWVDYARKDPGLAQKRLHPSLAARVSVDRFREIWASTAALDKFQAFQVTEGRGPSNDGWIAGRITTTTGGTHAARFDWSYVDGKFVIRSAEIDGKSVF